MQARQDWRKEDSRSYLTDDQRSMAKYIIKFSKKIVFTMNEVNRGAPNDWHSRKPRAGD